MSKTSTEPSYEAIDVSDDEAMEELIQDLRLKSPKNAVVIVNSNNGFAVNENGEYLFIPYALPNGKSQKSVKKEWLPVPFVLWDLFSSNEKENLFNNGSVSFLNEDYLKEMFSIVYNPDLYKLYKHVIDSKLRELRDQDLSYEVSIEPLEIVSAKTLSKNNQHVRPYGRGKKTRKIKRKHRKKSSRHRKKTKHYL
jgi:hypothetical protein